MDIYYGTRLTKLAQGKRFKNPSAFTGKTDPSATRVIVVGDWPRVVNAYKKAGIEVLVVSENDIALLNGSKHVDLPDVVLSQHTSSVGRLRVEIPADSGPTPDLNSRLDDQGVVHLRVEIPADWRQMPWVDLRRLAASVSNQPIINKVEAEAAILAAIERQKGIVDGDTSSGT